MDNVQSERKSEDKSFEKCHEEFLNKKSSKRNDLTHKVYSTRNSPLTDLLEDQNFRSIYHLFLSVLLGLFLKEGVNQFYGYDKKSQFGLRLIAMSFPKIALPVTLWLGLNIVSCSIYYGFLIWTNVRLKFKPKSRETKIWDRSVSFILITYYLSCLYFWPILLFYYQISMVSKFILLTEMIRIVMKSYAFVRSNAPRVLSYKAHGEDKLKKPQICVPTFATYTYFMFAPATIYTDNFPKRDRIRWSYVILCFVEIVAGIFFGSLVYETSQFSKLQDFGLRPYKLGEIVTLICENFLYGLALIVDLHYVILHAWQNLFAELLRFSDRLFYKDWWTSSDFSRYFRTWNILVHDWIYTYMYKDFYRHVCPENKILAKAFVFFVSAVIHEYILTFSLGFFLPILFVEFFLFAFPFTLIKSGGYMGNILQWYSLGLGSSNTIAIYALEYHCRVNYPEQEQSLSYHLMPQLWKCYNKWN